ncbi:bolA-like protein 3 isoform X2 [Phytophthora cinnamomi]|uniref:bolA-like protein 3 isoform X2 n=1 Tax=Phytophthora cinnamomi TaxID=4785 RepID=UPI0035594DA8|nr:bolA-like protein 3 isoform X2 [Phytophthora cinnamomi]
MLGLRGRVQAAKRPLGLARAWLSSSADGAGSEAEQAMHAALQTRLEAVHVKVTDVSGGCGSMFDIEVASAQFAGQSRVKQHRMVNEILKEEIKDMHGLTIRTMTPEQFQSK